VREGLAALFERAPIVALVEAHWVEQQHELLRELLLDDCYVEHVDDLAVEFGNAAHQELVDRYLAGEHVPELELQRVWTETVGGMRSRVFASPVYADFFRAVRRSRCIRGVDRPRVLLGDPPFDPQLQALAPRDEHFARVVEQQVLARKRRALILAGGGHLGRFSDVAGGNVVQRLERSRPGACVVVFTHYIFGDVAARRTAEVERLEGRLSQWPVPSLAPIHGSWLADVDPTLFLGDTARVLEPDGAIREVKAPPFRDDDGTPLHGVTLGDIAEFFLYLGPVSELTLLPPLRQRSVDWQRAERLAPRNPPPTADLRWAVQDSNLRPPACKAGALPAELTAQVPPAGFEPALPP
jgi:hypothetical protein